MVLECFVNYPVMLRCISLLVNTGGDTMRVESGGLNANPVLVNPMLVNPMLANPMLVNPVLANDVDAGQGQRGEQCRLLCRCQLHAQGRPQQIMLVHVQLTDTR